MDEIFGFIERITFQNAETGFTVAQLQEPRRSELTCLVGHMPDIQPGESVRCKGNWKQHPQHGRQFEVQECQTEAPADLVGIQKYLGSGLIKGIGPVYASRITAKFGLETLNIIENSPERLLEIARLGPKKLEKIKRCWSEQKSIRQVMVFLQSYGISPAFAQKIFKTYGDSCISKVKENPYILARDIRGIGFKSADAIAQKMGVAKDSPERIDAGIEYVLFDLSEEGHVCYPLSLFLLEAQETLSVDAKQIEARLEFQQKESRIHISDLSDGEGSRPFIWMKAFYMAEMGIARELKRLTRVPCHLRQIDTAKAIDWAQQQLKIQLAPNQQEAVLRSLIDKVHIITGGPGTGKSTITNVILNISAKLTGKILLAAPTGRAAKRMTEITGRKASTIHSLLEFDFNKGGFKRNRESPLDCDLIIIDEASMIDTLLMYALLKAIPSTSRVIFVGDINQLPSVSAGNVLRDMIDSHQIPVTMLNQIFRQAAGSRIITNAHRINQGEFPDIRNQRDSDFFFIETQEPEKALETLVTLVTQRLPKKYKLDPFQDIQLLSPMRRGLIGVENLNTILQEKLNPAGTSLFRAGRKYLVGDKVMQIRNNYKKEVYNGDIGRVVDIDMGEQQITVDFDGRQVLYEFMDLDELVLAYAVSVHKYQGSECPCIVMPVHTTHYKMLHRNLLYTGVTRGKKLVVLVGTPKALFIAVKNDEVKKRYTGLQQAIVES